MHKPNEDRKLVKGKVHPWPGAVSPKLADKRRRGARVKAPDGEAGIPDVRLLYDQESLLRAAFEVLGIDEAIRFGRATFDEESDWDWEKESEQQIEKS